MSRLLASAALASTLAASAHAYALNSGTLTLLPFAAGGLIKASGVTVE